MFRTSPTTTSSRAALRRGIRTPARCGSSTATTILAVEIRGRASAARLRRAEAPEAGVALACRGVDRAAEMFLVEQPNDGAAAGCQNLVGVVAALVTARQTKIAAAGHRATGGSELAEAAASSAAP